MPKGGERGPGEPGEQWWRRCQLSATRLPGIGNLDAKTLPMKVESETVTTESSNYEGAGRHLR